MQDLQLVGVHEDGEHLLLTTADGQRYRLAVDEPLRAAVRRDRARLGQLQIQIQGSLRPKDIQARIRAGDTAEDVATASGLPVEHVRRFEGPVLAERQHVAQRAQRQQVRAAGGRGQELGSLVEERLTAREASDAAWDAWRRDDGRWTVQLSFRTGSKDRRGRWTYDLVTSTIEPVDDESRWLTAAEAAEEGPIPGRRLAAVKERVYDVEADGGVREARRAAEARAGGTGRPAVPAQEPAEPPAESGTVDLLEELRGRRGRRQPVLTPEELAAADEAEQGADLPLPPPAHPPASQPHEAVDAEILALPEPPGSSGPGRPADADPAKSPQERADEPAADGPAADGPAAESGQTPEPPRPRGGRRKVSAAKGRRPSVPSWDEIVFGAKKD